MIFILSMKIPDEWKTPAWLMWDRRHTWFVCKAYYRDFQKAYSHLKNFERIESTIKEARATRRKA